MIKVMSIGAVCLSLIAMLLFLLQPKETAQREVHGIDVSHHQGLVSWEDVAESKKIVFAIAKATGGETYTDPQFAFNWHGIRATGLVRGAYHFFYAVDDPQKQLDNYLSAVGSFKATDLPPLLDVEITDNVTTEVLVEGVLQWLQLAEQATKRTPILYSDLSFAQQYFQDPRFSKYPLWTADYGPSVSNLPKPWQHWSIWQYSQNGTVDGVQGEVDLNKFYGNLTDFRHFIKQSHVN